METDPIDFVPVILAGGRGARLWPLSRQGAPKPLHALYGDRSLLTETASRVASPIEGVRLAASILTCDAAIAFEARDHVCAGGLDPFVLVEPEPRNTALAVLAAATVVADRFGPQCLLLAHTSDNVIVHTERFRSAISAAATVAAEGELALLGAAPTGPEDRFGYIVPVQPDTLSPIGRFVEKPTVQEAETLIGQGALWNVGVFLGRADAFLREGRHASAILSAAGDAVGRGVVEGPYLRLDPDAFGRAAAHPFDVAVMERVARAWVAPVEMGWSDVGDWEALWRLGAGEAADANVCVGQVVAEDSVGCYLRADAGAVAVMGVRDLVVIHAGDVVLVAPRSRAQDVKMMEARFRESGAGAR